MENKIFLGKYRVAAEEIAAVGELTDSPLTYEGEEIDSGKKVVVELVPAAALKAAVRERLEAEAATAKKLSHVNIPALNDFGVEDEHLVYITEDFEGTLAEEWVNTHGPMPVGPVLRIAAQVVSALGTAAFHRINHHAINPSNLVLVPGQTAEGEWPLVKVLHFVGVAPKFSGTDVAVAAFDKSLHYASPEQIQRGTVDFRSEIYSLGCTMWFLLTGAPPLTAPKGPMAMPPTKTGPSVDLMSAVPKKVRRLLAQMLSVKPDARPRDPLAFYRQLQDCLIQVELRETGARKFGFPVFSRTRSADAPGHRRIPMKTLALAALFLAIAALAALVLPGYLRHRRVVHAEEPIGVPIGVPNAFATATPVTASSANAITSNATQPTPAVADSNRTESGPSKSAESDNANPLPPATDTVESVSTNQVASAPVPPTTPDSPPNLRAQEPASIASNNSSTLPAATNSSEVASTRQMEAAPAATAESANAEANAVTQQSEGKKIIMHEVRRAEPAEPEVRRAEPAPPEEGPVDSVAAETTASDSESKVPAKSPAKKTERPEKPKRQAEETLAQPRLPRGSERARFMGVTPEGWWILEMPSKKIVIVPPPRSSH
ncbi:MAG: eukaryotic-like serine/threonine-protein kinase [Verrucomicrobiota bacterium]|jgi:serine/threonine-protein kinase